MLQEQGIASSDVKNLQDAGFHTIDSLFYAPKKSLLAVRGISEQKADKILAEAGKFMYIGFTLATEIHLKRSNLISLTTGESDYRIH